MDYQPSVTVVVCTHDRPGHLQNCLASLARQSYPRFDILVVESGPARSAQEISRNNCAGYVHEPIAGISRARNTGVGAARGEIVAFIDDDAVAENGWLASLVPVFRDLSIGAAAGGTRYMKSYGNDRFMSADIAQEPVRPYRVFDNNQDGWFASACFGGIGDGMNMAFRRSLLAHHVRFDERLGRGRVLDGGDEHVAFLLVLGLGYRIAHVPAAIVHHPAPADARALAIQRTAQLRSSIAYLFFLWFEFPAHRADLGRFVWNALRKRFGKHTSSAALPAPMSRWRAMWGAISGPAVYLKARWTWKEPGALPDEVPQTDMARPTHYRPSVQPTRRSGLRRV